MKTIYTSIDIGSDTVKFIVSELYKDKFNILASHTIKTKGIRKGLIVDANLVINTLKDGVKEKDLLVIVKRFYKRPKWGVSVDIK